MSLSKFFKNNLTTTKMKIKYFIEKMKLNSLKKNNKAVQFLPKKKSLYTVNDVLGAIVKSSFHYDFAHSKQEMNTRLNQDNHKKINHFYISNHCLFHLDKDKKLSYMPLNIALKKYIKNYDTPQIQKQLMPMVNFLNSNQAVKRANA